MKQNDVMTMILYALQGGDTRVEMRFSTQSACEDSSSLDDKPTLRGLQAAVWSQIANPCAL